MGVQATAAVEGDLLRRAASGDEYAFEALIRPHLQPAFRLAVTLLGDPSAAEDAVQESVLSAWTHLSRLRPGTKLRPWFLTVVANRCRSERRGRWWRVVRGLDPEQAPAFRPEATEAVLDLERALLALSADDRAAVFLRFYEDLPLDEVAAILGVSMTAARSRIHRALARMRLQLASEVDDL